ncbi:MAG: CinA family protein [Bacteroidaceae bacterium]|nr:CinA family protein [Bacteroidaceae bacterium]
MNARITALAAEVNALLRGLGFTLSTAESCTGGGVAAAITSCPGSSDVFKGSVVAYANEIKSSILGVSEEILTEYGAVSEATVRAMATGVSSLMKTDCAVATSGIAGPGGGTDEKPVGTVWVAIVVSGTVSVTLLQLPDRGRDENIKATIIKVLELLKLALCENVNAAK